MRTVGRCLLAVFTLLLAMQGELLYGARTRVVFCPAGGQDPLPKGFYGVCYALRPDVEGNPVICYDAKLPDATPVDRASRERLDACGIIPLDEALRKPGVKELKLFLELRPDTVSAAFAERIDRMLTACGIDPADVWLLTSDAEFHSLRSNRKSRGKGGIALIPAVGAPDCDAPAVLLHHTAVDDERLRMYRRSRRRILVWGVNDAEPLRRLIGYKVDYIFTDESGLTGRR